MKILIDIPKVMFINAKSDLLFGADILVNAIKNGTPLPKGHGRLIDADDLLDNTCIDEIPTIIEADTKSEGKDD